MDRGRTRAAKTRLDAIVGKNIKTERELRKMTRDELAEIIDLTVSHLGLIERGERGATPVTLEKVVSTFGISIDSLFTEPGKPAPADAKTKKAIGSYHKKVSALITHLGEPELELLAHTIKGIIATRRQDLQTKKIDDIFNENG